MWTTDSSHVILMVVVGFLLIQAPSATPCPQKCECSKRVVNCSRRKLSKIPEDIPPSVTTLYLGYNEITAIPAGSFKHLTNLTELSLKNNKIFSELTDVNAFRGLKKLKRLFLTGNKLTELHREHFKDLISLQRLYLTQNNMKAIPDMYYCTSLIRFVIDNNQLKKAEFPDGFSQLKNLTTVILSNNPITALEYTDVQPLNSSTIQNINMARCNLQEINASVFHMFPHLQSLTLSYNSLNAVMVQNIVSHLQTSHLTSLGLRGIRSTTLPAETFANFSAVPLRNLDLADSEINLLQNGTFTSLKHLVHLDLSRSEIVYIMDDTFGDIGVNLVLKLNHNSLQAVPKGLPSSLQELDLSHNEISRLDEQQFINLGHLSKLDLSNCNIHQLREGAFIGLYSLQVLDLGHNEIGGSSIGNKLFQPLGKLKSLSLKGNTMTTIPTQLKMFESLGGLTSLDLSDNHCSNLAQGLFSPLKSLQLLDLSGNDLGWYIENHAEWAFVDLKSLKELLVKNSGLYKLPTQLFHNLTSLKQLDLSHNKISEWDTGLFRDTQQISMVNLSNNGIAVINETSFQYLPRGVILDLTGNPFSCWCGLIWFRNWIDALKNTTNATLPGNASYVCHSPKSMLGQPVLNFVPSSIVRQCFPPPWMEIIIGAVLATVALFTGIVIIMYRYRWSIRLRWYEMKRNIAGRNRLRAGYAQMENQDGETVYDVCVLYGPRKEDCEWVKKTLVPKIEENNPGMSVFYEERDAMPNESDIGQIATAIFNSKKIILVLTSGYVSDSRREYEISLVFSSIGDRKVISHEVVIPVLLQENVDFRVPHILRPLFRDNHPITWTENSDAQSLFWDQLMDKLSRQITCTAVADT